MDIQVSEPKRKQVLSYEEQLFNKYVDAENAGEPTEEYANEISRVFNTRTVTLIFSNPDGETFLIFKGYVDGKLRSYTGRLEQFEKLREEGAL